MSVFARLQLSTIRLSVRPTIRERRNARVPSLDPTKGPFRAFRTLRLAENEEGIGVYSSHDLFAVSPKVRVANADTHRGRIKTYSG